MCRFFGSLILLVLLGGAALAMPALDARAQLVEAARLYEAGRYEESLRLTQRIYVHHPLPRLLFNMGQAYMKMGNLREALSCYEMYSQLEKDLSAEDRRRLQTAIETVRGLIAEQEEAEKRLLLPPKPHASQQPERKKSLAQSWWLWTSVGAAVTVTIVGVALGVAPHQSKIQAISLGF